MTVVLLSVNKLAINVLYIIAVFRANFSTFADVQGINPDSQRRKGRGGQRKKKSLERKKGRHKASF
ncbi:hypothetical protein LMH71_00060 [Enterovibrio norvegicus]|nr:hypothetical protein [Enterovibrio norvegicus]